MNGFALNSDGDLLIDEYKIQMTYDDDLLCQKIKCVLETNKGEWFFNVDEGIDFDNILGKHVDREELIRSEIIDGLAQIDETLTLTDFSCNINDANRTAAVTFSAVTANGAKAENITLDFN